MVSQNPESNQRSKTFNKLIQIIFKNVPLQKTKEKERAYKPNTKQQMVRGSYISIITINVNGLNTPTKRHRLAKWILKQDPYIFCL